MKVAEGFNHLGAGLIVIGCYGISLAFYVIITHQHEIGIVNAIWSGAGTVLVSIIGIAAFQESISLAKTVGIILVVGGVVALNLPEKPQAREELT